MAFQCVVIVLWTRQKFVLLRVARKPSFDVADLLLSARKQPLCNVKNRQIFAAYIFTTI